MRGLAGTNRQTDGGARTTAGHQRKNKNKSREALIPQIKTISGRELPSLASSIEMPDFRESAETKLPKGGLGAIKRQT